MEDHDPRDTIPDPVTRSAPAHPDASPDPRYVGSWARLALSLALRGALRPRLGIDLLRLAWAFRRRHWWRQAPFLPVPDPAYMRWRMYTAYGDELAVPPVEDVVSFARWRRETMGL